MIKRITKGDFKKCQKKPLNVVRNLLEFAVHNDSANGPFQFSLGSSTNTMIYKANVRKYPQSVAEWLFFESADFRKNMVRRCLTV